MIEVRLRKPSNKSLMFAVQARSEEPFRPSIFSPSPFMHIEASESDLQFAMSPAKSELRNEFRLTVLGNVVNWPDNESRVTAVVVNAHQSDGVFSNKDLGKTVRMRGDDVWVNGEPWNGFWGNASHPEDCTGRIVSVVQSVKGKVRLDSPNQCEFENPAHSLSVHIGLAPYASCTHTDAALEGTKIIVGKKIEGKVSLRIIARDTDGYPILNTRCEFRVEMRHQKGKPIALQVARDGRIGSWYSRVMPVDDLRVGSYALKIEILEGRAGTCGAWDDAAGSVPACELQQWKSARHTFDVACAPGYSSDADGKCQELDSDATCKSALVFIDGVPLKVSKDRTASSRIGEKASLTVHLDASSESEYKIRLLPLRQQKLAPVRMAMPVHDVGEFQLQLLMHNESSCLLLSQLTTSCIDGYEAIGDQCEQKVLCICAFAHALYTVAGRHMHVRFCANLL